MTLDKNTTLKVDFIFNIIHALNNRVKNLENGAIKKLLFTAILFMEV